MNGSATSVPAPLHQVPDAGVVLVVGSGGRLYREYLMAGAAQRHPLWLLNADPATWQDAYTAGSTVVELLDRDRLIPDEQRLIDAAVRIAETQRVVGVFTYDETLVITTARIAERLGLPGLTFEGADRCRNKHRTRATLAAAGVPQPGFAVATTLDDARAAADSMGYPVVLKPRGMGASIGVIRADGPAELDAAFAVAERASHGGSPSYEGGVLVEEFLVGPEISIDGAVFAGEHRPFVLAHKDKAMLPYFEEVGHVVSSTDPLLDDRELNDLLARAHRALGIGYGVTHTEVVLTPRGPVIVEVNARLGGDLIPYLGLLTSGIDPARVATELALGLRPTLHPTSVGTAGVRFLYPPHDCRFTGLSLPEPRSMAGLVDARAMVEPGAHLGLPPRAHLGRYAYLICTGDGPAECAARLDAAAAATRLEAEELDDSLV
jgi:biotin carboxylase